MHDWESLSHVRWDCKYHVVFVPKYRKKKLYGKFRRRVGEILKDLCRQKRIELLECQSASNFDPPGAKKESLPALQSPALVSGLNYLTMMGETIQKSGCHFLVTKHL